MEGKIKVPEGMLSAVEQALEDNDWPARPKEQSRVACEAALRWLSENPIVPSDEQFADMDQRWQALCLCKGQFLDHSPRKRKEAMTRDVTQFLIDLNRRELVRALPQIKMGVAQDDAQAPEGHAQPSKVDARRGGNVESSQGEADECKNQKDQGQHGCTSA